MSRLYTKKKQEFDDTVYGYLVKRLSMPITDTDAYHTGHVDEKGNELKAPDDWSYTRLDKLVFDLKAILGDRVNNLGKTYADVDAYALMNGNVDTGKYAENYQPVLAIIEEAAYIPAGLRGQAGEANETSELPLGDRISFALSVANFLLYAARFSRFPNTVEIDDEVLPSVERAIVWNFEKFWFPLAPNLELLATPGAGRELLPKDDEMPPGVKRINGSFHGIIMSETIVAFVLACARGLYAAEAFQRVGKLWPRAEMSPFCRRLEGSAALILGYGRIGRAAGRKLEALGVKVRGVSRSNASELDRLIPQADWLILALPSDTGTDGLLSRERIGLMKTSAVVVNVGRGNAIDEAALADALRDVREKGYGIVVPDMSELKLEEPEIMKQGGRYEGHR